MSDTETVEIDRDALYELKWAAERELTNSAAMTEKMESTMQSAVEAANDALEDDN